MGAIQYDGTHSINFFNLSESEPLCHNSWTDFHLVPSKRPHVNNPSLNYQYAAIPNSNTRKDVSAAFNRGQRNGEWEFYIDYDEWEDWATCYRAMVNYFHGFKMAVRLKDHEYDRMYEGRIVVKNYAPGNDYSKITLEYYFDNGYISDPSSMNFHFNVWWVDWDGTVRSENVPWGGTPSGPGGSGGGSGGTDGYSDPGSIYDNTTFTETFPTSIKIITKPSILSYYEGSTINYSGIVVSAYKSDGTLWSENSKYPNGAIPYAELRFPTSVASAGNSEGTQTLGVFWSRPNDGKYLNDAFIVTIIDTTPRFISITKLPTKLSYVDGDPINYSGISVRVYLSDGTLWSFNASYPNGYIPYSELILPTSVASMPDGGTEQTLEVQWARVKDEVKLSSTFTVTVAEAYNPYNLIERTYTEYINDEATYISDYAFFWYTSLIMASFKNVSKIGNYAFFGANNLNSLYLLYNGIVDIASTTVFRFVPSIYVPSSLYDSYITANIWSNYSNKFVSYI